LLAPLPPVPLKLSEQPAPLEQERKLGEQEIHLAIFEIWGENGFHFTHPK